MKVLFFGGGAMGELVRSVIESIGEVELINFDRGYAGLGMWAGSKDLPQFDILFSASYPSRIPEEFAARAALGAVNLHTGLLPEGRGWHPLNWALIWGRELTGITIHTITDTFDGGDILMQHEVPIFDSDTIVSLRERVESQVPQVVAAFFSNYKWFLTHPTKQNQAKVTYAPRRRPEDSELNLEASGWEQWNLYRSCHPREYPCFVIRNGIKWQVINGRYNQGVFTYQLGDYGVT